MTSRSVLVTGLLSLALGLAMPGVSSAGVQYVYDSSGRLIRAVYSNGVTLDYRYDSAGNRVAIDRATGTNAAPNALNDTATTVVSTGINIQVLSNDSDPNGNGMTVTTVGQPSAGTAEIQGAGSYVRYTAPATAGVYRFNYVASDGVGGLDAATVTVTVTGTPPANTPPVAVNDYYSLMTSNLTPMTFVANVLANDSDADGHALTITSVSAPTNSASASILNGKITLTNLRIGTTVFSYTISDGFGGTATGSATVYREYSPGGNCGGPGQPACP